MKMTNAEIITNARFELLKQGKIKGTGEFIMVADENGNEFEVEIPEEIHTFAYWKELGYMVRKGEKNVVRLTIWKGVKDKSEKPDGSEVETTKMFMKSACFFAASQVDAIQEV